LLEVTERVCRGNRKIGGEKAVGEKDICRGKSFARGSGDSVGD